MAFRGNKDDRLFSSAVGAERFPDAALLVAVDGIKWQQMLVNASKWHLETIGFSIRLWGLGVLPNAALQVANC